MKKTQKTFQSQSLSFLAQGGFKRAFLVHSIVLFSIVFSLFMTTPVYALTYTVNSLADTDDGTCDAHCTLREAINAANLNSGADIITVPAGTININMATFNGFVITGDLTIEGAGYDQTILDGGADPGIAPANFYTVISVSNANVILRNLKIQRGSTTSYGGGINQSGGSLTLENVSVQNNRSSGLGGGIYVYNANLTITDSDVSFNQAATGGGIGFMDNNTGTNTILTVDRTTLEGNLADTSGGIFFENDNGTHTFTNVTISTNVASDNVAAATFQDDDNDPGVAPNVKFVNTTIAENEAQTVTNPVDGISLDYVKIETVNTIFDKAVDSHSVCASEVVFDENSLSHGSNIASDATCWFLDDISDNVNTNPQLASITQNPNAIGRMHPISLNSPALDSGNAVYCALNNIIVDGRNSTRPVDGDADGYATCDIGAYELNPSIRYVAKSGNDSSNNCSNNLTPCATILHAVAQASDGDQINIGFGTYQEGEIAPFGKSLIFNGNEAGLTVLDGGNTNRVLFVYFGSKQILRNLSIEDGYSSSSGGGIYAVGALEIENVIVQNNLAEDNGGGIYTEDDTLRIEKSLITMNVANDGSGGGIFAGGLTHLSSSTISQNSARGTNSIGGGIHIQSASPSNQFFNVTVSRNNSTSSGDGISFSGLGLTSIVHNTIFENGETNIYVASSASFLNSIVAGSTSDQCLVEFGGSLVSEGYNLQGDGTCGFANTGDIQVADPQLLPLGDFSGPIPTHGFTISSPVVDAGLPSIDPVCAFVPNEDARGVSRNQDGNNDSISACDIGAFELVYESFAPTVYSITRASDNPSYAASVKYFVAFSQPVYGVDVSDFELTTTGVSNAGVTNVSGSGGLYTVTVNTGSGGGTLRLDVLNTATIKDLSNNDLTDLPYTSGESYTKITTASLRSLGTNDGWILESTETSTTGGTMDNIATTFNLGDDASDRQYRAILHFDTSSLPDNAIITSAILQLRKQGGSGTDPFTILGALRVDARRPSFGTAALQLADFKSTAARNNIATFNITPVNNWYSGTFSGPGRNYINKTGTTQFRVYFTTDDNNDNGIDIVRFFSGNAAAAARPKLVIQYYVP